jgi:hypothetical protein
MFWCSPGVYSPTAWRPRTDKEENLHRQDYIEIDAVECEAFTAGMTLREIGLLWDRIQKAYVNRDDAFLRSLPFIHRIHREAPKIAK